MKDFQKQKVETYCINRIDRKDRWYSVKKILQNEGWEVKKFNAIIDEKAPFFWCTLSHRKIIETALKKKLDYVCVLEDDIIFNGHGILKKVQQMIEMAPSDWHILYIGGALSRESNLKRVQNWFYQVEWMGDTHAIIYNKKCYRNLLSYLPIEKGISGEILWYRFLDHFLWFFYQKKFPCYVKKILINQKNDFSDIQKKVRKRQDWFERIRFSLYKTYIWRKIFIIGGQIFDYLWISKRAIDKTSGFGLDYLTKK